MVRPLVVGTRLLRVQLALIPDRNVRKWVVFDPKGRSDEAAPVFDFSICWGILSSFMD